MKRVPLSYILKLATRFERLAQMAQIDDRYKYLYSNLKTIYNIDQEEFSTWLQNNATVLGGKLDNTNIYWSKNYQGDLELNFDITDDNKPNKFFVITKSPKLHSIWDDSNFGKRDVVEENILRGTKNIPTMKLFVIESFPISDIGILPKELAHEGYLFTALSEMFSAPSQEDMLAFYNKYKKNIDRMRSLFHETPKYLGGGADGVAFSLGTNFILKIFQDTHSFEAAKKAVERLHKHPELAKTEAMIYDVGQLGVFSDEELPIYYYIMEKMKTVKSLDEVSQNAIRQIAKQVAAKIANIKHSNLKLLKSQIDDPTKYKEIKDEVSKLSNSIAFEIINSGYNKYVDVVELNLKLKENWLNQFIEELIMKYLTSRTDLHLGNLGVTQQGQLRYFDPAYSDWISKINI